MKKVFGVLLTLALLVGAAGALSVAAAGFLAGRWHVFDLAATFLAPALSATVILALVSVLARKPGIALALLLAAVGQAWMLGPQFRPDGPAPAADARPLRVYFNNIYKGNDDAARLLESIRSEDPDVVVLIEMTPAMLRKIEPGLSAYPHQINAVRPPGGGAPQIVIASRVPMDRPEATLRDGLAVAEAEIAAPSGPVRLIAVHLTRPWPFSHPFWQPNQTERLARRIHAGPGNERVLLVGDFNKTPSSALLRDFAQEAGLHPAAAVIGTWPAPLPGIFRIAIDNAFAGPGLAITNRRVAAPTGSDHRPIVFEVRLAQASGRPAS